MKRNHSKSISISVLIVFLLSCSNIFAVDPTTFPGTKDKTAQMKSKGPKSVKGHKNTKKIQTKSKGSKSIQRKGQKEAGVLVEPTAVE